LVSQAGGIIIAAVIIKKDIQLKTELARGRGLVLKYSPDQPRDERGRFGSGTAIGVGSDEATPSPADKVTVQQLQGRAVLIAARLGYPIDKIDIVNTEPDRFKVNGRLFTRGGDYDPATGRITVNAQVRNADPNLAVGNGIIAHEIMHAQYDDQLKAQAAEHAELARLSPEERARLASPEGADEAGRRFPASSAMARTWGDEYLGAGQRQQMIAEDGHTAYAKQFWTPEALAQPKGLELAVHQTLAEVARVVHAPGSKSGADATPSQRWKDFANDVILAYHVAHGLSREFRP
jgi:hypothetical protein